MEGCSAQEKESKMSQLKVLGPGVVHEYNTDGQYNYTAHVEAQLRVLEQLCPAEGAQLRARFESVCSSRYADGDHINKVASTISQQLDALAPDGHYYGAPRDNSNIAGFWPNEWLHHGPADAVARAIGPCTIGPQVEVKPKGSRPGM